MNYNLAKQLKDAGFPQVTKEGKFLYGTPNELIGPDYEWGRESYAPTLSELIGACGEKFGCLVRLEDGEYETWAMYELDYDPEDWGADILVGRSHTAHIGSISSTPEEAVANLWLALNKK